MKCSNFLAIISFSTSVWYCHSISNNVSYYEDIIKKQINESIHYQYQTNSSIYYAHEEKIIDIGIFDFIIVGAGSTGSVIANRLSKVRRWKILLLEAGQCGNDVTDIPNMAPMVQLSDYNWGYKSLRQKTVCLDMFEQKCVHPRGRGIGGSTLLNGLVYARGNRLDFDKWAQKGNPGWSFDDIFPYFKKSENFNRTDPDVETDWEYHGSGGELNVAYPVPRHPLTNIWIEANQEKGYKIVDYNGKEQIGAGVTQLNIKNGRRADAGSSFIKPVKDRPNLRIWTKSFVTKLIIRNSRVVGVRFAHDGQTYLARTRKEVILSAGAIGSPQILMLSGVGPKEHLEQLGIHTIVDLPVGSTLRDHAVFTGLSFSSNYTETIKPLDEYIKEYLNGTGAMTSPHYHGGVSFHQTKYEEPDYPDLEIIMVPNDGFTRFLGMQLAQAKEKSFQHLQTGSFSIIPVAIHTKSTGTVRLQSRNPFDYPLIDSNLLSDSESRDINTLYEGVKLALDLINSQTYASINATLVKQNVPACQNEDYLSEDYWYCLLRHFTINGYHDAGTCPMGPDPMKDVVDSNAKVYGIRNLRVADASIFPFTLSGHPNAACVMVGEKVSDLIKLQYL